MCPIHWTLVPTDGQAAACLLGVAGHSGSPAGKIQRPSQNWAGGAFLNCQKQRSFGSSSSVMAAWPPRADLPNSQNWAAGTFLNCVEQTNSESSNSVTAAWLSTIDFPTSTESDGKDFSQLSGTKQFRANRLGGGPSVVAYRSNSRLYSPPSP